VWVLIGGEHIAPLRRDMDVETGRGSSFVRDSAGSGTDHNPRHRKSPRKCFAGKSNSAPGKACVERCTAFMDPSYTADTGPLTDEEINNGMLALSNEIDDHAPMPDLIRDEGCTYGVGKSLEAMALYVSSYMAK
jgi:hypothetical protein